MIEILKRKLSDKRNLITFSEPIDELLLLLKNSPGNLNKKDHLLFLKYLLEVFSSLQNDPDKQKQKLSEIENEVHQFIKSEAAKKDDFLQLVHQSLLQEYWEQIQQFLLFILESQDDQEIASAISFFRELFTETLIDQISISILLELEELNSQHATVKLIDVWHVSINLFIKKIPYNNIVEEKYWNIFQPYLTIIYTSNFNQNQTFSLLETIDAKISSQF